MRRDKTEAFGTNLEYLAAHLDYLRSMAAWRIKNRKDGGNPHGASAQGIPAESSVTRRSLQAKRERLALTHKALKSPSPKRRSRGPGLIGSIRVLALLPFRLAFVLAQFLVRTSGSKSPSTMPPAPQSHGPTWRVHLAGRKYRPDVPIAENEQLVLCLDKGNIHDDNAVRVVKHDGRQVGFIAREDNREVAGWLRDGNSATAFVTKADSSWPLLKVYVT